ncbi:M13 family metallopeptidase [Dyella japonica]|uniref:Peptidase M13 n=1 Tax=Dyella japonica A8 TaxID=1217721 RepID=A0A075JWQ8_9GAMM|nr:M13 family metallopeptidase [Dyella japonica]AIF45912.1 peptidase M13 [Dyella japonica A8]
MVSKILAAACVCALTFGAAHAADPAAGKPQYGAWGFDQAGADTSVKPGNDFFRYANGTWLDRTPIPADKPAVSLRLAMTDLTEQRLHDLMETAAKSKAGDATIEGKVGAFYQSFMDQSHIDALGAKPIAPQLDAVKQATTRDAQAALMGRTNTDFEGSLFNLGIDVDLKDISHYSVYLSQAGLGMPDRDYYLKPAFAKQKAAYQAYVARLLTLAGWPQPDAAAKDVVAFETAIAEASISKVEQRDPVAMYNPMSVDELKKLAPGFAWNDFLQSAQLGQLTHVVVMEKTAFPKLTALYARTPVATVQAWQAARIADNAAYYLSEPFQQAYFEMHNKTLAGQEQIEARWKRGVHAVSGGDCSVGERLACFGNLGWGVGELYAGKYFPASSKTKIEALVANLKAAYRVRIEKLDWMGAETRKEALKKLDTYTIKVGYPDHPRDYSNVTVRGDDLAGNVLRAAQADWSFYVNRLDKPVDRDDWSMTPQTNDAYNGSLRDIVFPAAILQPPIFDPNADPAINYGAIGGVIGHELTHGFDDEGRKIDASGALRDWWTPADAKAFEERAKKLGAQYDAFDPLPGVHINGNLTMGENIADLGGLTLALDAYHASLHGKPAPVIDGLTGDQRVFLGWAQAWRGKLTDDAIRRQVTSDPHSPRAFRVNGPVRNIDAWYQAFGVQAGEKLYLDPKERVRIW